MSGCGTAALEPRGEIKFFIGGEINFLLGNLGKYTSDLLLTRDCGGVC